MDERNLGDLIDHQRWLMNNGLMNDLAKNNLYLYGSIVHKDVQAVEVTIDVVEKVVAYRLYLTSRLLSRVKKFDELQKSQSLFDLWRLRRILKKDGNLNFSKMLEKFVKDFCGPTWAVKLELEDYKFYQDSIEEFKGEGPRLPNNQADQQPNR